MQQEVARPITWSHASEIVSEAFATWHSAKDAQAEALAALMQTVAEVLSNDNLLQRSGEDASLDDVENVSSIATVLVDEYISNARLSTMLLKLLEITKGQLSGTEASELTHMQRDADLRAFHDRFAAPVSMLHISDVVEFLGKGFSMSEMVRQASRTIIGKTDAPQTLD